MDAARGRTRGEMRRRIEEYSGRSGARGQRGEEASMLPENSESSRNLPLSAAPSATGIELPEAHGYPAAQTSLHECTHTHASKR